jgi:hypothetical protein
LDPVITAVFPVSVITDLSFTISYLVLGGSHTMLRLQNKG